MDAFYRCKSGYLKIKYTDGAVCGISITERIDSENNPSGLSDSAFAQLCEYLDGRRKSFDFPLRIPATTPFREKVWRELCNIPYGETRTYSQIAAAVGNPKACRAVGGACNKNPLWIAVPCHRVIGSDGSLTGYEGGLDIKRELLELERRHSK
ncbi:MAG: methylated-DNA--[protein]-cysteine S-methyltransferase [Clostridiales bacterium]|nr:methylated-DNA--[protein]-cysteine S-methyltransferase [Clostridiales bacterium]